MGLTKQALIHHFGSKERLYALVLKRMASEMVGIVERTEKSSMSPVEKLESLFLNIYEGTQSHQDTTLLLMRELMDNRKRAPKARRWYLTDYLNSVVDILCSAEQSKGLSRSSALARVYAIYGAINYFAVSSATLKQMFGEKAYALLVAEYPNEIKRLVRSAVAGELAS